MKQSAVGGPSGPPAPAVQCGMCVLSVQFAGKMRKRHKTLVQFYNSSLLSEPAVASPPRAGEVVASFEISYEWSRCSIYHN